MKIITALATAVTVAIGAALTFAAAAPAFAETPDAGSARIYAEVSISQQQMQVFVELPDGGVQSFVWTVSTGAAGYETPTGEFSPTWLSRHHRSRTYNNAPMPWAVFFHKGYAVHATEHVGQLGQPASHGCVRLAPENAAVFFDLVKTYGRDSTEIVIVN